MVERWCWHFTGMIRDDGGSWVGEDELDEAMAEIERLTKERDDAWSMLADAERDMRQRAADLCDCACMDGIGDKIRAIGDEILALPLKYMGQIHAECDCPHPDRCTSYCIAERNKRTLMIG